MDPIISQQYESIYADAKLTYDPANPHIEQNEVKLVIKYTSLILLGLVIFLWLLYGVDRFLAYITLFLFLFYTSKRYIDEKALKKNKLIYTIDDKRIFSKTIKN
ncbi:MAG: hypothetical protein INQ03_05400 [Candidatus Heimdallarchaeota archaeon]|nr:hypothetical protein [Candidatus Heimdallarchaeota archaeon]